MRRAGILVLSMLACSACREDAQPEPGPSSTGAADPAVDVYALDLRNLAGDPIDLDAYRGRVTVVLNVASEDTFAYQNTDILQLIESSNGLYVSFLLFPCNDFGTEEPGDRAAIRARWAAKWPGLLPYLMEPVAIADPATRAPIYSALEKLTGRAPRWNYWKFVIGRDGRNAAWFGPDERPIGQGMRDAIEQRLRP
jgi:glutathione peroxidase